MTYQEFLESKILQVPNTGIQIEEKDIHPSSMPHQRDVITWATTGGNRAVFANFGMGKTHIQLNICKIITEKEKGKALIICPLGVKGEFKKEAARMGYQIEYVRSQSEVENAKTDILITNYERVRDGDIDPNYFSCITLDEASVLRSYGSKTYQQFLTSFRDVKYKFVCTATPSPNRYKEIIHYAGFLGIMDTGQALTRFFQRDSTKANNLTLYPHKEKEFWLWVSSWAIFLTKPSDLGYSDEGFDLPELDVKYHMIDVAPKNLIVDRQTNQIMAFKDSVFNLSKAAREKRESLPYRIEKMKEIINDEDHYILWHHLESERAEIEKSVDCKSVYGSQAEEIKEQNLIDFGDGKYRILATKPEIAGSGCNFQMHCHKNIFLGIDYKFNDFIQAIHRTHRFQQQHQVEVHVIYTRTEAPILKELLKKWERHNEMVGKMTEIIKKYGLHNKNRIESMRRSIGIKRQSVKSDLYEIAHNDAVLETQSMEENSVGLIVTSIPFSNHYEYTPSYNDFGHTNDDDHFFGQMDYLTPELLRILQPGRVACIHVKDRILFGNVTGMGMPTVNPFHAKTLFHFLKHGFAFMGMITIETDVVRENNQTYRLGWTEQCKDGSKMGVGSPEYLLLFRKLPSDTSTAYADIPVTKSKDQYHRGRWQIDARAKWNSSGNRLLTPEELKSGIDVINKKFSYALQESIYDYDSHIEVAVELEKAEKLPATFETLKVPARYDYVWSDVNRMRTLNTNQSQKREQNHICPLQFDIVDRCIERYSNPGEVVFDPFGGLMTVPYRAVLKGRIGKASELNPEYFEAGRRYMYEAEHKMLSPTLFDVA